MQSQSACFVELFELRDSHLPCPAKVDRDRINGRLSGDCATKALCVETISLMESQHRISHCRMTASATRACNSLKAISVVRVVSTTPIV